MLVVALGWLDLVALWLSYFGYVYVVIFDETLGESSPHPHPILVAKSVS